eukprot:scaffold11702_cov95-Isochrysis_galbana.AAC.2
MNESPVYTLVCGDCLGLPAGMSSVSEMLGCWLCWFVAVGGCPPWPAACLPHKGTAGGDQPAGRTLTLTCLCPPPISPISPPRAYVAHKAQPPPPRTATYT